MRDFSSYSTSDTRITLPCCRGHNFWESGHESLFLLTASITHGEVLHRHMELLISYDPQDVTAEGLEKLLAQLPEWRREKALSFLKPIDRVLCAEAYLLLCRILEEKYGICEQPSFAYGHNGKPVLEHYPDIHFNLSHCHRGVLCVVDDKPVGCDIEEFSSELHRDLCQWCFSQDETSRILASDTPIEEFTRLWTMKEAMLKLSGEGLRDDMARLLTPDTLAAVDMQTTVDRERGLAYSICRYK